MCPGGHARILDLSCHRIDFRYTYNIWCDSDEECEYSFLATCYTRQSNNFIKDSKWISQYRLNSKDFISHPILRLHSLEFDLYSSGTIGAPGSPVSVLDCILPLVSLSTNPPDFFPRAWSNVLWCQGVVLRRMPFFGECRVNGLQTIIATNRLSSTIRTTPFLSCGNYSFPFMAFATNPPDFLVRFRNNISWGQVAVFCGMPFLSKAGTYYLKVVLWGCYCHLGLRPRHFGSQALNLRQELLFRTGLT